MNTIINRDLEDMLAGYVECALWTDFDSGRCKECGEIVEYMNVFATFPNANPYSDSDFWLNHDPDCSRYGNDPDTETGCNHDEDSELDMSDFAEGELDKYRARCAEFLDANANDLSEYEDTISYDSSKGTPMEYAGHDLWLTEHGHGAGFWCRDLGELGDRLTSAVIDRCGEGVPYLANGKVYVS